MEHSRLASFGIYSLLLAATPALAAPTGEQLVKGPYCGAYVCQTRAGMPGIFRVPIDLVIRDGTVEFARPLLNRNATRVVGNEMAFGTIDGDGKIHLTSTWFNGRALFHAEYTGTLTPSGGTLTGTQTWRGIVNGSRTCTAALVQLAAADQMPPQQSPPDPSQTGQSQPGRLQPDQPQPGQLQPDRLDQLEPDQSPPQQ